MCVDFFLFFLFNPSRDLGGRGGGGGGEEEEEEEKRSTISPSVRRPTGWSGTTTRRRGRRGENDQV